MACWQVRYPTLSRRLLVLSTAGSIIIKCFAVIWDLLITRLRHGTLNVELPQNPRNPVSPKGIRRRQSFHSEPYCANAYFQASLKLSDTLAIQRKLQ